MEKSRVKYYFFIWYLFLFLIFTGSKAQNTRYLLNHYSIHNGLIQNSVEYIYIDQEGYVWLGTYAGLQRFDGYNFTSFSYDPDDSTSISDNFITTIFGDNSGNLWIGTYSHGLNMFNEESETFLHFRNKPGSVKSLSSDNIPRGKKVITQDREGYLWVNTNYGLNKINILNKTVEPYFGDFKGQIVYDKEEHAIWIASDRLKKFKIKTHNLEFYDINKSMSKEFKEITSIIMGNDGLIWLGTNAGIFIYQKEQNRFFTLPDYFTDKRTQTDYSWSFNSVAGVYEDFQGFIWFGIGKKIFKLNKTNGKYEFFAHETDNTNSLLDGSISGIYGNKTGILWISYLNMGISKANINLKKFQHYRHVPGNPNSLSGNTVRSVFKDDFQYLWIGTYNNGLNKINLITKDINHYRFQPGDVNTLTSDYITNIYIDKAKRLWIGTFNSGFCYADKIYQSENLKFIRVELQDNLEIHEFTEDPAGRIFIGTQFGFYVHNRENEEFIHYGNMKNQLPVLQNINIQSVVFQSPNIFWLATWNRGVCKFYLNSDSVLTPSIEEDKIIIYDQITDIDNSIIDNRFITAFKGEENIIWLGSYVNGLVKMTEKDNEAEFIKYDKSKGAPDNSVYGIACDMKGNIWISTNNGISRFNPVAGHFTNYYESDGLQSNSFMWESSYQSNDGQIFFGGINGLNAFYPDSIIDNMSLPNIFITKLIIHNKEVHAGDIINGRKVLNKNIRFTESITLSHKESAFSLEFTAIDNVNPKENLYAYKLEGFDEEWINTNAEKRYVTYTNLKKGIYYFKVKASNSDGVWNEEPAVLRIEVLPPWWKTAWAMIIFVFLFMSLLLIFRRFILIRAHLKHEIKMEHMEREKAEEMYQMKLRFFTNISHEFRTPLTLILAPLQKIISAIENDKRLAKQILLIKRNTNRLFRLIEQVIEFRKIETNNIKLHVTKSDLVALLRELTNSFDDIAAQRSITLRFCSENETYETWFDEDKMDKIIYNLLTNAFKFTADKGFITVYFSLINNNKNEIEDAELDNTNKFTEIKVKDNGIGISDQDIDHVFDRYYQAENSESFVQSGSGIGLALTKELVELHKGKISVESTLGKGSCFTILLPDGKDHFTEDQIADKTQLEEYKQDTFKQYELTEDYETLKDSPYNIKEEKQVEKKPLLLIVEDEPDVQTFLSGHFSSKYEIIKASNGIEGLGMSNKNNPDLIISDILMPLMDGVKMCKELKSNINTSHIPIILLTAKAAIESRIEGLETGADAYISKPFSVKLLETQIDNLLESRNQLKNKFSKEFIIKPSEITITSVDAKFLEKAMNIVETHISDPYYSSELFSKEIGKSRSHLHKKLKALTAQSASEFIRTIRLKRAVQLLKESQLTIEEVAYKVGFNSPAYFSKCFRNQFGISPSAFTHSKNLEIKSES
jgi:signal transduction histidine kinase/ligand-binding sensor domain-containing protein/AraC-like DNA-binding protein